jgi:hypothetical protein
MKEQFLKMKIRCPIESFDTIKRINGEESILYLPQKNPQR